MMVRVGGGWDTLEHFLSRHEPCQVRLVTQGRRASLLPLSHTPPPDRSVSPASSTGSKPSLPDTSPVDSKASSVSGKISPLRDHSLRRTSTPNRQRSARPSLALPLNPCLNEVDNVRPQKSVASRNRKQSAPSSYSTPNTPVTRNAKTPTNENRKSIVSSDLVNVKKSRSMSLATVQKSDDKKSFCGTDRLNSQAKKTKSSSLATTPTKESYTFNARKARSQSLATTPDKEQKKSFCGTDKLNSNAKKTRSMSLASTTMPLKPMNKSISVATSGGLTQAAIEESIRQSLAASIVDEASPNKPFLHIKAKYRSPPPREVPPR